jgi:hypothetical protein
MKGQCVFHTAASSYGEGRERGLVALGVEMGRFGPEIHE